MLHTDFNTTSPDDIATVQAGSRDGGGDIQTPFMKLSDDGDAVIVAFLGSPHLHAVTWDGTRTRSSDTTVLQPTIRCQLRIAINVAVCELVRVNREPSMRILDVRVWEHSRRVYGQLLTLTRTFWTGDWLFLVERQGKAFSKETTYAILPVYALGDEDRVALRNLPLHDLNELFGADARGLPAQGPVRINAAELALLMRDLNRLPDPVSAMRAFCLHFGIHLIEQLPKADLPEARIYLARLGGDVSNPFA